jgi:hypothetical protein
VNKELEAHENPSLDESRKPPDGPNIQGAALQMNDNSAGGKKPASPQPPDAGEPNPPKGHVWTTPADQGLIFSSVRVVGAVMSSAICEAATRPSMRFVAVQ